MPSVLRCPSCGRGYPTRWRLKRHIAVHVRDGAAAFVLASTVVREPVLSFWRCSDCFRQFNSRQGLTIHLRLARHAVPDREMDRHEIPEFV